MAARGHVNGGDPAVRLGGMKRSGSFTSAYTGSIRCIRGQCLIRSEAIRSEGLGDDQRFLEGAEDPGDAFDGLEVGSAELGAAADDDDARIGIDAVHLADKIARFGI